jgi:septal ring factor EnvC (AmiA/AmiB activator)
MHLLPTSAWRLTILCVSLLLASGSALAEDKPGRDKEALRRVQQALRQSQAKLQAAVDEKALLQTKHSELEGQLAQSAKDLSSLQAQLRGVRGELSRSQGDAARLSAELSALRSSSQAEQASLQGQVNELNRRLADNTQTLGNVTGLLGHSTQALATAEQKNRQLYAIGRDVIERYRNKGFGQVLAQQEPVFGLREVTLENEAEALRDQIEAQRLVVPGGAATMAPTGAGKR